MGSLEENEDGLFFNSRWTLYPDETSLAHFSRPIRFGSVASEGADIKDVGHISEHCRKSYNDINRSDKDREHCEKVSMNRTKNRIYYLARSNRWEWFITLTFSQGDFPSDNYEWCINKVKSFFNHLRARKSPDIKYLIIPELHKDGAHYHFHGLLSCTAGCRFEKSGIKHEGRNVYNWFDWSYGFTTCTRVRSNERVVKYVTKYITKSSEISAANRKRYYCSNNLDRADIIKGFLPCTFDDYLADNHSSIKHLKSVDIKPAKMHVNYVELDRADTINCFLPCTFDEYENFSGSCSSIKCLNQIQVGPAKNHSYYVELENPQEADADTEQENPDT